jgi:iron complex outermembrane receptor protein
MKNFKPTQLALLVGALFAAPALWAQTAQSQAPTDVGRISVEGQGGGTATGLITQEDTPKARSSVSRAHLDTLNPSSNPYQAIELLPGVSTFSQDATGLFGGGLRVRGANSDQMGFTINGAPVNDSGSFTVFPQEYSDTENLCEVFVTQGSTDTEAPHVGASGGNIGMVTCPPKDKFGVKYVQSFGQLNYYKTFLRVDTGKFANDMLKLFLSYSKSKADKFKGPGGADRDHVDFGAEFQPNASFKASTSFLYNRAINNNILTLTYAQINQFGTNLDVSSTPPQHLTPVAGTVQAESTTNNPPNGYYAFNINPFRNWLWTGKAEYKLSKDTSFSAEPYFWFGYGTGGNQLTTVREGNSGSLLGNGVKDINGDGDTLDTVLVYRSSVTRTYRPGATFKANFRIDNNDLLLGYWYERARHIQTAPAERIDNNGNTPDIWLQSESDLLHRQSGGIYQNRDQLTVSTGSNIFLQDNIHLMQDKLNLQLGIRDARIHREFTNYANEGFQQGADYQVDKTYSKTLGSFGARYALDDKQSVFGSIAQNMKAPGNFSFGGLVLGGTYVNGKLTNYTVRDPVVNAETSTNMDLGYRYFSDKLTFSGLVYYNAFKNRIASSFDTQAQNTIDYNVGDAIFKGFEIELGYQLSPNWSLYSSLSNTDSKMLEDKVQTSATYTEATKGKQLPDTPPWLASLSLNYNSENWYGNVQGKYTGKVFSTLVNDQEAAGYTIVNTTLGYRFGPAWFFKNPSLQLNVQNLLGREYVRVNSPSGSLFTVRATTIPGAPSASQPAYYIGAPRFTSVTFRTEF